MTYVHVNYPVDVADIGSRHSAQKYKNNMRWYKMAAIHLPENIHWCSLYFVGNIPTLQSDLLMMNKSLDSADLCKVLRRHWGHTVDHMASLLYLHSEERLKIKDLNGLNHKGSPL